MSKIKDIYDKAVARFGSDNVGAMCNVTGAIDGTLASVPAHRHDELAAVLTRMMGNGASIARAQADFVTLKDVRKPQTLDGRAIMDRFNKAEGDDRSPPTTLDATAIFRKWNNSRAK